jgi:hypothetical protein
MARINTTLGTVTAPLSDASILVPQKLPFMTGNDPEDLACGGCGTILCSGVVTLTAKARFAAPVQLLIKCPVPACGNLNVLPSKMKGTQ